MPSFKSHCWNSNIATTCVKVRSTNLRAPQKKNSAKKSKETWRTEKSSVASDSWRKSYVFKYKLQHHQFLGVQLGCMCFCHF